MILLDELKNDTMLTVKSANNCDFSVMTKADFLDSAEYLDMDINYANTIPEVTVAKKEVHEFDWESVVERFEEESFEDFGLEFWLSISEEDTKILNQAMEIVNKALEENPNWYEGKNVQIIIKDSPNES